MKRRFLMGQGLGLVLATSVSLAETPKLLSQSVQCGSSLIITGNKIDRKSTCELSLKGIVNGNSLMIKQTVNPCFFIDKDQWEMWKGKKVNDNTVSFTAAKGKQNVPTSFNATSRPDLGHSLKFHNDGTITNDGYEVLQVLGKDRKCYLKPTTELWTVYGLGGDVQGVGEFYLK